MKWEVLIAMIVLMFLGFWVVWGQQPRGTDGAQQYKFQLGPMKGWVEHKPDAELPFRVLLRDGKAGEWMTADEFSRLVPEGAAVLQHAESNWLFRAFNVTSWGSVAWVIVGLGGQIAFFGRMAVQWIVSERRGESVVPPIFWYLSLVGGITLFAYFAWRQDPVGVLGQTSGVVIYARNIRLLHKQRRRAARRAARQAGAAPAVPPAPEAGA